MSNKQSIEFANARIKALEKNLLTKERITRLLDCSELSDALRILSEVNYGGGILLDNPLLFDILLKEEEKRVTSLVISLMPDGYGFESFLIKNDYHNAKVYYKGRFSKGANENALKPTGVIDKLDTLISAKVYKSLPDGMREALEYLDNLSESGEITPRTIDLALDKGYFKDVFAILKRSKNSVIHDYFINLVDYTNILSTERIRKIGGNESELELSYIYGGTLSLKELKEVLNRSVNENAEVYRFSDYSKIFSLVSKDSSLVSLERFIDNESISLFKRDKTDMFSPSPIAGFYIGKLIELKDVRLILVCLSNGVDKKEIKRRLRETYA